MSSRIVTAICSRWPSAYRGQSEGTQGLGTNHVCYTSHTLESCSAYYVKTQISLIQVTMARCFPNGWHFLWPCEEDPLCWWQSPGHKGISSWEAALRSHKEPSTQEGHRELALFAKVKWSRDGQLGQCVLLLEYNWGPRESCFNPICAGWNARYSCDESQREFLFWWSCVPSQGPKNNK